MGLLDTLFGGDDLTLRSPRFAEMLYPADPAELDGRLTELLDAANAAQTVAGRPAEPGEQPAELGGPLRALIVPHAEYAFAGPVMAAGWSQWVGAEAAVDRVVVVGSSRLVPFRGLAVTGFDGFETPLGPLVADRQAVDELVELDAVRPIEAAFAPESSIEVQLPFVRKVLGDDVAVVAVLLGDAADTDVADVLGRFAADPAAVIVVSANLSSDVPVERAERLDDQAQRAIIAGQPDGVGRNHSHGRVAIRGLLRAAGAAGLDPRLLRRATSADTADSAVAAVTGYGAFGFYGSAAG